MKYYTFNSQFNAPILNRIKVSTIRSHAKVSPGERFALRHWLDEPHRTSPCWLGSAVCVRVRRIRIWCNRHMSVEIDGKMLNFEEVSRLAYHEGFIDRYTMEQWFMEKHNIEVKPLNAVLTEWDPSTLIAGEAQP